MKLKHIRWIENTHITKHMPKQSHTFFQLLLNFFRLTINFNIVSEKKQ